MNTSLLVICSENTDPHWRWLEPNFANTDVKFEFASCAPRYFIEKLGMSSLAGLRGAFQAVRLARRKKAIALIAHGPRPAAWCALIARFLNFRIQIVAHSFNFTALPSRLKRRVFRVAFSHITKFVVYSTAERSLYADTFHIPKDRIEVTRWAVRPPEVDDSQGAMSMDPYVAAIGGNARDYKTLIEAARRLPGIRFILVVRPDSLNGLALPPNVSVYTDISFGRAMNVLAHSRFMALPLINSEVPCGHVTVVAAMHLAKAFVITASSGVRDYVRNGENGVTVTAGSVAELAAAIERLWEDPNLCVTMGRAGQHFAARECSEEHAVAQLHKWLESTRGAE